MRRVGLALAAMALVSSLAAGCVPSGGGGQRPSDRVTVILGERPATLCPYSPSLSARRVGRLLFSGLFMQSPAGPVPDLAERVPTVANGDLAPDRRAATIRLRRRSWGDGKPVTSADVVFTWRMLRDGALTDSPSAGVGAVTDVRAVDTETVRVTLSAPDSPSLWRLVPYVLPEHRLAGSHDLSGDPYWAAPLGSGSYRVSTSTAGGLVLDPVDRGVGIDVLFAGTAADARSIFDAVDRAAWFGAPVGPASASESYDSTSGLSWRLFQMNVRPGHPTSDPSVRRALALMIPRGEGQPAARGPYGLPALSPSPDTRSALRILEATGWKRNRAGLLARGGRVLRVVLVDAAETPEQGNRTAQILAAWRSIGIDARELVGAGAQYYAPVNESGMLSSGAFDVAWTWARSPLPVGFAWPYGPGGLPSNESPYGPNVTGAGGGALDVESARLRAADDPGQARIAAARAWARLYAARIVIPDSPIEETVLTKGVLGVRAALAPEEAIAGAPEWSLTGK